MEAHAILNSAIMVSTSLFPSLFLCQILQWNHRSSRIISWIAFCFVLWKLFHSKPRKIFQIMQCENPGDLGESANGHKHPSTWREATQFGWQWNAWSIDKCPHCCGWCHLCYHALHSCCWVDGPSKWCGHSCFHQTGHWHKWKRNAERWDNHRCVASPCQQFQSFNSPCLLWLSWVVSTLHWQRILLFC